MSNIILSNGTICQTSFYPLEQYVKDHFRGTGGMGHYFVIGSE
jgi:hypothetical protein